MKKSLLILLGIIILSSTIGAAHSKTASNKDVMEAVKLYRAGNYTECYTRLSDYVKVEQANALAYYYLAMSAAQVGKKGEAIDNYNRVISLSSLNSNIGRYANKGKVCIESPDKCNSVSIDASAGEAFILSKKGPKFSEEFKSIHEKIKINEMMREINRNNKIEADRFKEYKDFSSMNIDEMTPSNDEIVAALKTLQKAGFTGMTNNSFDLSMLTDSNQNYSMLGIMNNASSLSPQLIQTMLTNSMSQGF